MCPREHNVPLAIFIILHSVCIVNSFFAIAAAYYICKWIDRNQPDNIPKKAQEPPLLSFSFCVERMTISSFTVKTIISYSVRFVNRFLEIAFVKNLRFNEKAASGEAAFVQGIYFSFSLSRLMSRMFTRPSEFISASFICSVVSFLKFKRCFWRRTASRMVTLPSWLRSAVS